MDNDPAKQPFCPFALPEDEYWDMMFARRVAPEGTTSPPLLAHQLSAMSLEGGRAARRYSTVDDTDGMHAYLFVRKRGGSMIFQIHDRRQHRSVGLKKAAILVRRRVREHRCLQKYPRLVEDKVVKDQWIKVPTMVRRMRKRSARRWQKMRTIARLPC